MTGLEPIESTIRQVLEHATVRARVGAERITVVSAKERDAILAAYKQHIDNDMVMLHECLLQARLTGIERVHTALHDSAVDHEMLDEAVHYAETDDK